MFTVCFNLFFFTPSGQGAIRKGENILVALQVNFIHILIALAGETVGWLSSSPSREQWFGGLQNRKASGLISR